MKLSDIKQLLKERAIRLTKSLGQNFLHDANQLRRIADAAQLTKSDKVLEIGPGLGALTELLVLEAGEVLAIEKDWRLAAVLRERFGLAGQAPSLPPDSIPASRRISALGGESIPSASQQGTTETGWKPILLLVQDDALEYLRREARDWSEWKLVSNLPYSVASAILVELAWAKGGPKRIVVTLQMEAAQRLMAGAGEADYGMLTLLVQLDYEPIEWFKIPASCFFPEPEVDSACVCLARRSQPLLEPEQKTKLRKIVKRSFSQRRKMMLKLLKQDWPLQKLEEAFDQATLPAQIRAEAVSLEQFVRLARIL
jgi:16S rRNA (adenine1518-N6/adenine1519-N6)-dimethyltransferase